MTRHMSAGMAGLCFLGCGLIAVLAQAMTLIRIHGPALREFIHWLVTPQFCIGALGMAAAVCVCGLILAWSDN